MYEPKDLINVKNLQRLMAKVKAELDMQEVLAAGDVLRWLANLAIKIENDVKMQEVKMKEVKMSTPPSTVTAPEGESSKKKPKKA
jgi:hypothetical protein